jgi:hypothetical protein
MSPTLRLVPSSLLPVLFVVACTSEAGPPGVGAPVGLAAVGSDYHSVSVPLIDPVAGTVTRPGCLTSGSAAPGLTTALSGDVVLPSQPQPGHELLIIDRTNATLTWVDPGTCAVLRQLNVGEGSAANPHDVIAVSAHKAYVTRSAPSASDLLVIDPAAATILGHVDLRSQSSWPGADRPVHPMPDRGLLLGSAVYVSLNELTDDFEIAGPGRVVVVDPARDAVTATIDLPALQNCGALASVESARALAVACAGVFSAGPQQVDASGVAWIDLGVTPPASSVVPAEWFGAAVSNLDVAVLAPAFGFTVASGDFASMRPDALWAFDLPAGAPRKVLDGSGPFSLGGLVVDAARRRLFIGDASDNDPRILVIDATDPARPTVQKPIAISGLPPRSLAFY